MEIYESYELAEGSLYPSMTHSFESIENILDTIETIRYNSNEDFFAFSSEGFVDFIKKIWDKFVALVKRFANWIKELFGRIFQTGVLRKAVKGAKYSVNIAFKKGFKSESIIKKYGSDDKVMKEFRKYCVDLRFFTWFAFGSGGEDIDAISKSLNGITDIDSIISKLMESGADISDTVKSYSKAFEDDYNVIQGYIENNDKGYNQKLNREQTENLDSPIVNAVKTIRDVFMKVVGNSVTFEQYYDKSLDFKKRKEVPMFHANKVYDRQKVLENFMKTFNDLTAKIEKYDTSKYTEKEDAEKISKVCQMLAIVFKTVSKFLSFINNNIMSAAKSIIILKKENKKLAPIVDDLEKTGGKNVLMTTSLRPSGVSPTVVNKTLDKYQYDDRAIQAFRQTIVDLKRENYFGHEIYVFNDMVDDIPEEYEKTFKNSAYTPLGTYTLLSAEKIKIGIKNDLIIGFKSFFESTKDTVDENGTYMIESVILHEKGHNKSFRHAELSNSVDFSDFRNDVIHVFENKNRANFIRKNIEKDFGKEVSDIVDRIVDEKGGLRMFEAYFNDEFYADIYSISKKPSYNIYNFLINKVDYKIRDKYFMRKMLDLFRVIDEKGGLDPSSQARVDISKEVANYYLKNNGQ